MDTSISKHSRDIIQKYASSLFKDTTLELYGIKTAKIKELVNVDLPIMEVSGSSADIVFLLEDDSYLHLEFQTGYNKSDFIRFAGYDLRLYERDKRIINTVVIYSADVKHAPSVLALGSLTYNPGIVMMASYDGNAIYTDLQEKVKDGFSLSDLDMLNLIYLPLMRTDMPRYELAAKSVLLAQTIPNDTKRNACIAAAFVFASRFLEKDEADMILKEVKMIDLVELLVKDAVDIALKEQEIKIALSFIQRGTPIKTVSEIIGIEVPVLEQLINGVGN